MLAITIEKLQEILSDLQKTKTAKRSIDAELILFDVLGAAKANASPMVFDISRD